MSKQMWEAITKVAAAEKRADWFTPKQQEILGYGPYASRNKLQAQRAGQEKELAAMPEVMPENPLERGMYQAGSLWHQIPKDYRGLLLGALGLGGMGMMSRGSYGLGSLMTLPALYGLYQMYGKHFGSTPAQPAAPAAPAATAAAPDRPAPPARKEAGYTIQVAAFQQKEKAYALANTLNSQGFQAQVISKTNPAGETWHRVRVGSFTSPEEAKQLLPQLGQLSSKPQITPTE